MTDYVRNHSDTDHNDAHNHKTVVAAAVVADDAQVGLAALADNSNNNHSPAATAVGVEAWVAKASEAQAVTVAKPASGRSPQDNLF